MLQRCHSSCCYSLISQINFTRIPYTGTWASNEPVVYFHVCFSSVDVYVNDWLVEILIEDSTLDSSVTTRFDLWWHAIIVQRGGFYNRT
jgi:hypothetical protein